MNAAYGYFVYNVPNDGPHHVYLNKDPFVIGTGPESDWMIRVDEPGVGGGGEVCRLVFRESKGQIRPHIVCHGKMSVQFQSIHIKRGQYYALWEDVIVKIPRIVEKNTVTLWTTMTYKDIQPNSIFSRYHFTRILGTGGFGTVHEGVAVATGRRHAVKVVRKMRCLQSGTIKDPVQKEVEILKAQNHPYIVALDDVFQDQHLLYLVMELAAEGSLHDLLVRETRLSESDAKLVTLDVCSALTHLHSMSIVHRDIKPANILIRSRNPLSVKVSDFGLAKIVDGGTDLRTMCGTPEFMAPEIGPMESYDNKVDTWALGVTLFAILSGKSPFSSREESFRIQWDRLPVGTSKLGTQLMCLMLVVKASSRPTPSEIAKHNWFLVPASQQLEVQAQPKKAARPTKTTRPTKTAQPKPAVPEASVAVQHAKDEKNKRIIIALLVLGFMLGCNTWQDVLLGLVVMAAIATFTQMS